MPALSRTSFSFRYLTAFLAGAVVMLGITALVTTLWIVIRTYSPVLFGDQWELIRTLIASHGHPSLADFWAQHNEHRIVTGRLLGFADLYFFGGRNVSLFAEIIAIQLCHLVLFLVVLRRFASLPPKVYVTVAGFLIYCLFSPVQIENFMWAFQTVFVLTSLAATGACVAMLCHAQRTAKAGSAKPGFLLLAVASAFLGEMSEAHGLVIWVVLLFLAFALRFSRRDKSILFVAVTVAIAAYLIGYKSPDPGSSAFVAFRQPGKIFHFIVTYLGRSWDSHLPNPSHWPSVSESLTTLVIVSIVAWSVWVLRKPHKFSPLQTALIGNLLFVLGTAAMTAMGRLKLGGLEGATAIRYQTPALVFWGSFLILIAISVDWSSPQRLAVAQAMLLILMLAGGGRWVDMGRVAEARQFVEEIGWNAVVEGRTDDPALRDLYYDPKLLQVFVAYLQKHRWGPAGEITSFARMQPVSGPLRIEGYRLQQNACSGHWDEARRSGLTSVSVGGWSVSERAGQAPRRVAFASGAGKIIGYADVNQFRPDVAAQYPSARGVRTGWGPNLTVPGKGLYHAFLLFEEGGTACPIGGELRIGNYPVF